MHIIFNFTKITFKYILETREKKRVAQGRGKVRRMKILNKIINIKYLIILRNIWNIFLNDSCFFA